MKVSELKFLSMVMILGVVVWSLSWSASMLHAAEDVDLTGETCLSGSAVIDPDGVGPLPPPSPIA